jgi:hypothetical protein
MKRFRDPKFFEAFLIFFIIQPLLFFYCMFVFFYAVYQSIWG